MKKLSSSRYYLVFFLLGIFLVGLGFFLSRISTQQETAKVCFSKNCFLVELAKTPTAQQRGLMGRQTLDADKGMLFIFEKEALYPFWMKNTFIPLDIIWLDANNTVVFIAESVQPCKQDVCPATHPNSVAKEVLELSAGVAKKINLSVGDTVDIFYH